jgi:diguanylate cyclase (GGDEF)-like protein
MIASGVQAAALDVPTLAFVAICIAAMMGLFLIFAWLQQRNVRALAWWGSAYLIGAASMALWAAPTPVYRLPSDIPAAMMFIACGMIWNGVRLFHGRRLLLLASFSGALVWLIASRLPIFPEGPAHIALGALVIAAYTFAIAFELNRERRRSLYSKTSAVVVPCLHACIFLMPLAMRAFLPEVLGASWLEIFALETTIYAIGTAFIVLLMVKDHYVHVYRTAANTDALTGLLNRRAFLESARDLCVYQGKRDAPVTLMMFDLDHFKSVNDRFGHAVGDEILQVFAQSARKSMRANDIIGRIGGEEFAAIVPAKLDIAMRIAERIRKTFETMGATLGERDVAATVSIGLASACEPIMEVGPLLARADAALYRAKNDGRNRVVAVSEEAVSEQSRLIGAARNANDAGEVVVLRRKTAA